MADDKIDFVRSLTKSNNWYEATRRKFKMKNFLKSRGGVVKQCEKKLSADLHICHLLSYSVTQLNRQWPATLKAEKLSLLLSKFSHG